MKRKWVFFLGVVLLSLSFGTYQSGWYSLTPNKERLLSGIILYNTTDLIEVSSIFLAKVGIYDLRASLVRNVFEYLIQFFHKKNANLPA